MIAKFLLFVTYSTVKLLEEHNYYGLKKENVTIMKQNGVPAIKNTTCEIATKEDGHMIFKPHGHGDIHLLMSQVHSIQSIHFRITFLRNGPKWARNMSFSSRYKWIISSWLCSSSWGIREVWL